MVIESMDEGRSVTVDLLYGDHEGGQRTISRFMVTQLPNDQDAWMCSVVRHWTSTARTRASRR